MSVQKASEAMRAKDTTVNVARNTLRSEGEAEKQNEEKKARQKGKKTKEPEFEVINNVDTKEKKKNKKTSPKKDKKPFVIDQRVKWGFGAALLVIGIYFLIAFMLYLIGQPYDTDTSAQSTGVAGGSLAKWFIKDSFGLGSFLFVALLFMGGMALFTKRIKLNPWKIWGYSLVFLGWIPLFFAYILPNTAFGGNIGNWYRGLALKYIGDVGTILLLALTFIIYLIVTFKDSIVRLSEKIKNNMLERENNKEEDALAETDNNTTTEQPELTNPEMTDDSNDTDPETDLTYDEEDIELPEITLVTEDENEEEQNTDTEQDDEKDDIKLDIEETEEEETSDEITHYGLDVPYDPHLDLKDYKFPSLDLLIEYTDSNVTVEQDELESNKNKIVKTLSNYSIGIEKIKATIGPTVTLYEIVPAAGVRIARIKSLENDIALSLAALGIRIIAPIPGKGTVGIEVPNKKPKTVSMRSVLASEKFQNNEFALPFAMGKTITNETYVADLAKMPHILMAGATGQGKSVGLNAIIASLLYSKHPTELKFVLVDPKKVELSLFNKIERHYLAKLPDSEEAIITDTKKVVRTLNSLCIEMDNRYELLKDAQVRNIKEYNAKFISRRLNPNNGHHFLPYIVLVVDEFADLMITAGKEVEKPIMRLAQLARAIGIHLIIATQRPSVNIITGTIKANFPARIAFRVMQRIDSHTILDASGAEQLVGRGDMLISTGNDLIRIQCAFIDTPEVDALTEFIGSQRGFSDAYHLPEYNDEEETSLSDDFDGDERDPLFEDAAYIVVQTQQGSTSMLQRKLKLGYNRAGRIIDQLEKAGIVGPFAGSKTREVKIANEMALEQFLKDLDLDNTNHNF